MKKGSGLIYGFERQQDFWFSENEQIRANEIPLELPSR